MNSTLFQILATLKEGPTDVTTAMDRLRGILGPHQTPSIPAFYRHLRRSEEEGWITIQGEVETSGGMGRPRKIFGLTPAGEEALASEATRLQPFIALAQGKN